jgi:hypothetical protein
MRVVHLASHALFLLLLLPGAQGAVELSLEAPATYINLGQGVTATLTATEDGSPVANVKVEVQEGASQRTYITDEEGTIALGLYHDTDPGVVEVSAQAVERLGEDGFQPETSNVVEEAFTWTQVGLQLSGEDGPVPAGEPYAVTVTAAWLHDGSPVEALRVHFLGSGDIYRVTDAEGSAVVHFTRATAGTIDVGATVDEADRPQDIWTGEIPTLTLTFSEPEPEPEADPEEDPGEEDEGDDGGGGGGGGGGDPEDPGDDDPGQDDGAEGPANCGPEGTDSDSDGLGDACDTDRDGDLVHDDFDDFPDDPGESDDADGDGEGDSPSNDSTDPERDTKEKDSNGTPGTPVGLLGLAILGVAILQRNRP